MLCACTFRGEVDDIAEWGWNMTVMMMSLNQWVGIQYGTQCPHDIQPKTYNNGCGNGGHLKFVCEFRLHECTNNAQLLCIYRSPRCWSIDNK